MFWEGYGSAVPLEIVNESGFSPEGMALFATRRFLNRVHQIAHRVDD
jgi:hypothetical protein